MEKDCSACLKNNWLTVPYPDVGQSVREVELRLQLIHSITLDCTLLQLMNASPDPWLMQVMVVEAPSPCSIKPSTLLMVILEFIV